MGELRLSVQYKNAVDLNEKIIFSAQMAQGYLWEMCRALKEMRDSKLYKELGYHNFEEYCEKEVGMKRRNAYNYISIAERINPENVQPVAQIGIKKLALLSTLSEEQQKEVSEAVDLESTTYRELKAEIARLKEEKQKADKAAADANQQRIFFVAYGDNHFFLVIVFVAVLIGHYDNNAIVLHIFFICHFFHLCRLIDNLFYPISMKTVKPALQDKYCRHLINDLAPLLAGYIRFNQ